MLRLRLDIATVDLDRLVVDLGHKTVQLGDLEARLLARLVAEQGQPVPAQDLCDAVWGRDAGQRADLHVLVKRLRSKIEAAPGRPVHLLTVRGQGYRLDAAVEASSRDASPGGPPVPSVPLRFGDVEVDLAGAVVRRGDREEGLTPTEVSLLAHLARSPGVAVPNAVLLTEVWEYDPKVQSRTLDTTVARLRKKLEPDPSAPVILLRQRGAGLLLAVPEPAGAIGSAGGRAADVAALVDRLEAGVRCLVVHGPGGVGKTHTVRALFDALRAVGRGPAEVVWCELERTRRTDEALARVARALWLDEALPRTRLQAETALGEAMARRPGTWLVLDGLEGCAEAMGPAIDTFLDLAPGLVVVCTSRHEVPSRAASHLPLGPLDRAAAMALLRTQVAAVGGVLVDGDAAALERIVDRAEALPLTLELVAARCAWLGVEATADGLDPSALERSHTRRRLASLDDSVRVSWELLDDDHRQALLACALFNAPFSLRALAAVLPAGLDATEAAETLRRRSLLTLKREAGQPPRLAQLAAIRSFARARLAELPDRVAWEGRYHAWLVGEALAVVERRMRWEDDGHRMRTLLGEFDQVIAQPDTPTEVLAALVSGLASSLVAEGRAADLERLVAALVRRAPDWQDDARCVEAVARALSVRCGPEGVTSEAIWARALAVDDPRAIASAALAHARFFGHADRADDAVAVLDTAATRTAGHTATLGRLGFQLASERAIWLAARRDPRAVTACAEAQAMVPRDAPPEDHCSMAMDLARVYALMGDLASTRHLARSCVRRAREAGQAERAATYAFGAGYAEVELGLAAEALSTLQVTVDAFDPATAPPLALQARICQVQAHLDVGDVDAAEALLMDAAARVAAREQRQLDVEIATFTGLIAHLRGAYGAALVAYRQVVPPEATPSGWKGFVAAMAVLAARSLGDVATAGAWRAQLDEMARGSDRAAEVVAVLDRPAEPSTYATWTLRVLARLVGSDRGARRPSRG
ncbi:MAG: winged helix-turn-helix domain-containing protein [Alphaproteobacteria bacterium]|nr:winged helix-turn-helix domain-containing protein [Alphaproteobacteria bacterium]